MYPERKAAETMIFAYKLYLCSFYFRITKRNWGESKETHCILGTVHYTIQAAAAWPKIIRQTEWARSTVRSIT